MSEPTNPTRPDPVHARRAQVAKWTLIANRVGSCCPRSRWPCSSSLRRRLHRRDGAAGPACLVVGSFLLAPAIVLGYAVKAAEREDGEGGR